MEVDYITGRESHLVFGMHRRHKEVYERLKHSIDVIEIDYRAPANPLLSLFVSYVYYPYLIKREQRKESIKHITDQWFAYILNLYRMDESIVTCHDIYHYITKEYSEYNFFFNSMFAFSIRGLKKADRIIAVSEFTKKEIIKYLKYPEQDITVIYNGVDHDRCVGVLNNKNVKESSYLDENFKNILYVGSEAPRKNFDGLIKAFYLLKKKYPMTRLIKVGDAQWKGGREKNLYLIKKLNLQKDVLFTGYLSDDELLKTYTMVDLFVFPSFYEGFGIPPLEAMACGTPVITSNTTSLPEVVGDAGVMVNPNNIEGLAKTMHEVLTNNALRQDLIKKGLERAKMFSWDRTTKETLRVYEEII